MALTNGCPPAILRLFKNELNGAPVMKDTTIEKAMEQLRSAIDKHFEEKNSGGNV